MIKDLNAQQQKQLAYFKALELTNASIKTGVIKVTPEFNKNITQLVRTLISDKTLQIGDEIFDISDDNVFEIIREGLYLFNEWQSGLSKGNKMYEFSRDLCKQLKPLIYEGLIHLKNNVSEYTEEFVEKVSGKFLEV